MIPVPQELLEQLASEAPSEQKRKGNGAAAAEEPDGVEAVRRQCAEHNLEITDASPYKDTYRLKLSCCPIDSSHKEAAVFVRDNGKIGFHCFHESCKGKKWRDVLRLWGVEEKTSKTSSRQATTQPTGAASLELADAIRNLAVEEGLVIFDRRRGIAQLIQDHLTTRGTCFHTPDGRGFFFHQPERRIYGVESETFERLVASVSGLSLTETHFKFALDQFQTHVLRNSPLNTVHTLARYDPGSGTIAVSDGGSGIWMREKGGQWQERHNGDEGIFFSTDDDATAWQPDFSNQKALRWFLDQMLFANHQELSIEDSKTLVGVWLLQQFFPELRRTRLVLCFLGPQGSCKTSAERFIGRLLVGPRFDVTGIRHDKEDAFVAAVTNRTVLGLDNADSRIPWLPDALATYATGQRYRLRKLYSTNEEVSYSPRAILLISSRDPRFNRADVVERLLPLHCERPALYRPEDQIFGELESRRGAIMGALLAELGKIADALPTSKPRSLSFRMADFASFGERIFRGRSTSSEFLDLLTKLEKVQAQFASEADGLVEVLRLLLEQENIKDISSGDLFKKCQQMANANSLMITKTPQGFGRHLTNMRRVIEIELQVRFLETSGHGGTRYISLVPVGDTKPTPGQTPAEELHGTA